MHGPSAHVAGHMEIAKALILAGHGAGDRPWPTAPVGPRHLFPIANRPILCHNLAALRAAGVLEAAILADRDAGDAIRQAVGDGREWGLSVRYVDWESARGIGGALAAGHEFLRGEPVLVQEGAALLGERMHAHISAFAREQLDALALRLASQPVGNVHARAPGYLLSPRAVSIVLDEHDESWDPVAEIRAHGGRVRVERVDGCLPCDGDLEALLEGNRRMLEGLATSYEPESLEDCRVQGGGDVHPTARITRTLLRGPVIIGPGARVTDAYIGPYTSIGAGVVIEGTEIEHSILLPKAELRFVGTRLESSLVGRGARVVRGFQMPGALRVSIGDGAEVVLR
jgi:glucose-1-phosphate thymidylyltransferase